MTLRRLLRHGALAGAAAGLAAAVVMDALVEPVIRRALVIEDARAGAGHAGMVVAAHAADEVVTRGQQVMAGLLTAVLVGVIFGGLFSVVFAKVRHRLPARSEQGRAVVLALLGYGAFVLLPALRIPANPPAVGDPATVDRRTLIYAASVLLGVLLVGALFAMDRFLAGTDLTDAVRRCLLVLAGVAGLVLVMLVVPASPDRIPADVPPAVIWDFRVASLAQLGAMWAVLGLGLGLLVERDAARRPATVAA